MPTDGWVAPASGRSGGGTDSDSVGEGGGSSTNVAGNAIGVGTSDTGWCCLPDVTCASPVPSGSSVHDPQSDGLRTAEAA